MSTRMEAAEKLFKEGYNCSQSVFAAFSNLYGIDRDMALRLSASFGGGVGRMREICGAVSGMCMIAGLETGSSKEMDDAGKKYNYEVVQTLSQDFKNISGSIICRELLGLDTKDNTDTTPQMRTEAYYQTRPCEQLVKDAAGIIEQVLFAISFEPVASEDQIREVAALAEEIWHEHYDTMLGSEQVNYMVEKFQSEKAMKEQMEHSGYQYYRLISLAGTVGYFAIQEEAASFFLSKIYIARKYRGRGYARKALDFIEQLCLEKKLKKIWLTVNRNNLNSIKVYEKFGFTKTAEKVADIGSGFVMDDFIMEKVLM